MPTSIVTHTHMHTQSTKKNANTWQRQVPMH